MPDKIEEDAKLDSSPDENTDAKPDSSTGDPIETDAKEDSSTPIAEESDDEDVREGVPVQNQIGELKRRLEESEAEQARTFALLEETLNRTPAAPTGPVEVDTYEKELSDLGIEPDVAAVLKKHRDKGIREAKDALRAEMAPLQEGMIASQERAEVVRLLDQKGSDVLKGKEEEIYNLINTYKPDIRARMGASKVAVESIASVAGHYIPELIEEDRKAARKKGKSSKRIISESLSDASGISSVPVDGLTPEEKEYVKMAQSKGSEITEDGYLKAKQRIAKQRVPR